MYRVEHTFAQVINLSLLAACCSIVKAHTCRSVGQDHIFFNSNTKTTNYSMPPHLLELWDSESTIP